MTTVKPFYAYGGHVTLPVLQNTHQAFKFCETVTVQADLCHDTTSTNGITTNRNTNTSASRQGSSSTIETIRILAVFTKIQTTASEKK